MIAVIRSQSEIVPRPDSRADAAARPLGVIAAAPSAKRGDAAGITLDASSPEAEALQATGVQHALPQRGRAVSEALHPTLPESFAASCGATLDASSQEGKQLIAQFAATGGSQENTGRPTAAAAPLPVENWDRYDLLKLLGQGGMGAVYKARDCKLDRIVALKFIRGNDEQMSTRFLQEARTQSKIDHPGICKVHEVGEVEGKPYIAMQFVDGASLAQLAAKLSVHEKVAIIRDAAVAMHAAHQLGIIHRDIKAANIMVETRPGGYFPIVMDFGLAREASEHRGLTESGAVMGTPAFMSPEQARGDVRNLDRRTDVYSLGATLFDLLAGRPPFADDSVVNVILQVLTHEAPSLSDRVPELPRALDVITNKCLAKEPKERYQTAAELAADLSRFLEQKQIVGKKVSLRSRLMWKAKTNRPLAAAVLGFALTVLGFLGYGVRTYVQNLRQERAAKRQAELAQRLGQEMKDMEWLLRTARGMPLHDLGREKKIVRQRMLALESEFVSFGASGQPLAHYALGRGHMGLHEYPEALKELQLAIAQGFQSGEAYYALGVVLGKHYEKAMYEARLAGGGDWARKRLKEIEPQYLTPAILALRRARQSQSASPEFLEALIAYYARDFSAALAHIKMVLEQTPWLYEAHKLTGDIHLERALEAHDHGEDEQAEREFAAAVQSFGTAAEIGRSDGEVYEALAETWVRTIEVAANSGQPVTKAYAAAVAASNQITESEPESTAGPLKKAYASLMTLGLLGSGTGSAERAQACIADAQDVLRRHADNPYASDVYAGCLAMAAEGAQAAGKDPVPLLEKALGQLEPAVQKAPYFLGYHVAWMEAVIFR